MLQSKKLIVLIYLIIKIVLIMKYLNNFIKKYWYELRDTLTYNSYAVKWSRDTHREWDSISVTEILSLIIEPNFEIVKDIHSESIEKACSYGTNIHNTLEEYVLWHIELPNENIYRQFKLSIIKERIKPIIPEEMFALNIDWLPPITGTIDLQADIKWVKNIIDYKTSRKNRNFITIKHLLQICFYIKLSWIQKWWLLYLNKKWYKLKLFSDKEIEEWLNIVSDLIEYTKHLYNTWMVINLKNKKNKLWLKQ